jgi:hypothetical protein
MRPELGDAKEARVLGRIITYTAEGITYEADPRHVELMVEQCGFSLPTRAVATPGVQMHRGESYVDKPLNAADASMYRSLAMRGQYLSLDRPDIAFATKELARTLQEPTNDSWQALERLVRYLRDHPRLLWDFPFQGPVGSFIHFTDSDDAGCLRTRASTSCGALLHGTHLIKHYSSTQKQLSLSSGESEFYATVKAASSGLGAINMAEDLGLQLGCAIGSDASASISLTSRVGHGKTKHIARNFLWIQQRIREGLISIFKVPTDDNPADIGTKHLDNGKIQHLLGLLNLKFQGGQSRLALKAAKGGSTHKVG